MNDSSRFVLIPKFTAASVFFSRLATSTRPWKYETSSLACVKAEPSPFKSPERLRWSIATASKARATTARRKSSASWLPSATNAATSQDDSRTLVSCRTTVDIDRPREGGAAINCSQIVSRHLSVASDPAGAADSAECALAALSPFAGDTCTDAG